MTVEHLRPLLDNVRDLRLFHSLAEGLAQGAVLEAIVDALRLGRYVGVSDHCPTTWDGCGICNSTLPVRPQDTCRMRVNCTRLQGLCDVDPNATIISIDVIGAFDQILELQCWRG